MVISSKLGNISVGEKESVCLMGVLNVSPESFYKGSIKTQLPTAIEKVEKMAALGADIVDIGGMSTAPYKDTYVTEEKELKRVLPVVEGIKEEVNVEVSVDTQRSRVAKEVLKAGASIINDVSGLKNDRKMAEILSDYNASTILMARGQDEKQYGTPNDPVAIIREELRKSLRIAQKAGIPKENIVIDPGIGFWRGMGRTWSEWDTFVLRELKRLLILQVPICVGVSRKSFIGKILGQEDPEERLIGSVATEAIAVINGAHVIRTHNILETRQTVKMAEELRTSRKIVHKGDVKAEELPGLKKNDLEHLLTQTLEVHPGGTKIMGGKGVLKNILLTSVPETLALVLKQEMLSKGGEVALPKAAIQSKMGRVDLLLMGTIHQYEKVIKKLRMMDFSYLEEKGFNAPDLAEVIERFIHE